MAQNSWKKFLERLNSPLMRKGDYSLDHIKRFHEAFGNPGDDLKIIHVAGTNAKGTVTYKLAKMLELSGHKVGMFISPHQFSWRERVQINGGLISKEDCGMFVERLYEMEKKLGTDLTFFEFFTMLAFYYFREQKVDAAVIEVGLGGRLDATNIAKKSLLSVITSISLDHTKVLGYDVDTIGAEKCGIIKEGCPVLIGPQVPLDVARRFCNERNAPLHISEERGNDFVEENTILLKKAAQLIGKSLKLTNKAVDEACLNHNLPCRLEPLRDDLLSRHQRLKSVHFDVGHNPDAILKTLASYSRRVTMCRTAIVYGCKILKDYHSCMSVMLSFMPRRVCVVQSCYPGHKSGIVAAAAIRDAVDHRADVHCVNDGSITDTLQHIVNSEDIDHVLVIGSFTIMRESRQFFGIDDASDD